MLVLTRKQNEKIRVGDSIVITVLRMKGKAVRLGIEAPADVNVLRGELAFEPLASEAQPADDLSEEPSLRPTTHGAAKSHREAADRWPTETKADTTRPGPLQAMMAARTV